MLLIQKKKNHKTCNHNPILKALIRIMSHYRTNLILVDKILINRQMKMLRVIIKLLNNLVNNQIIAIKKMKILRNLILILIFKL